jgi:signal peptidase I
MMQTSRHAAEPALRGQGWVRVLAMSASRSYLILIATLGMMAILPSVFGWSASVVQSESMAPHVSTGDVVISSQLPETSPIPVGGVITFRIDDRLVVHRAVTLTEDNSIVTAGDANAEFDPWSITRADITGQARLLVPHIGLPGLWAQRGDVVPLAAWLTLTAVAIAAAMPYRTRRRVSDNGNAGREAPEDGSPARLAGVGSAALAGLVAVCLTAVPLEPADAAFTGASRMSSSWKAKTYSAISVGNLAGYGALAGSSVRDTNFLFYQSTVDGAIGTSPGTSVSGFREWDADAIHLNDQSAKNAMTAARNLRTAVLERPVTRSLPAALSGTVLGGVYTSTTGAFSINGTVTLDAKGDPSARFVFRTTTTLTMAQRARILLTNGAKAANVYWVVGTTATLGALTTSTPDTTAVGNLLVAGEVALRGVALTGRAVSFDGSISLNGQITPPN